MLISNHKQNLKRLLGAILKIAGISLGFVFLFDKSIFYHLIDIIKNFGNTLSVETLITGIISVQHFAIIQQCSFLISLGCLLFKCSLLAASLVGIALFVISIIERIQPSTINVVCNPAKVAMVGGNIYLQTSRLIC